MYSVWKKYSLFSKVLRVRATASFSVGTSISQKSERGASYYRRILNRLNWLARIQNNWVVALVCWAYTFGRSTVNFDGERPKVPDVLTRRIVFHVCRRLTGHFPVCSWLRVAAAFVKRRANAVTGWDDETWKIPCFVECLKKYWDRHKLIQCMVNGQEGTVWVDASSLATSVAVEYDGAIIEDANWLRPVHSVKYMHLGELDAVLRGVNLALHWRANVIHLRMDSACVHRWISDTLSGKAREASDANKTPTEHAPRLFSWAVWHSCRMGVRNQEQTRGRIGPQLRLGNLRVGELHFCPLCTALDQASSLSRKLAYVPGPTFRFVKLLASSGSHCTKWADEQHRQAGFESRLVPDLPLPFTPTLIGLRAFDLVSSRVWWEAATNIEYAPWISGGVWTDDWRGTR